MLPWIVQHIQEPSCDDKVQATPMTDDEMRQLVDDIVSLSGTKEHDYIVEIILSQNPSLHDNNADKIEVDFKTVEPSTLRLLQSFTSQCLRIDVASRKVDG